MKSVYVEFIYMNYMEMYTLAHYHNYVKSHSTTMLLFHNVHTNICSLGSQHSCVYWLMYMKFNIHVCAIYQCFVLQDQSLPFSAKGLALPPLHDSISIADCYLPNLFWIYLYFLAYIYIHIYDIYSTHLVLLEYGHMDALLPGSGGLPCCHDKL